MYNSWFHACAGFTVIGQLCVCNNIFSPSSSSWLICYTTFFFFFFLPCSFPEHLKMCLISNMVSQYGCTKYFSFSKTSQRDIQAWGKKPRQVVSHNLCEQHFFESVCHSQLLEQVINCRAPAFYVAVKFERCIPSESHITCFWGHKESYLLFWSLFKQSINETR